MGAKFEHFLKRFSGRFLKSLPFSRHKSGSVFRFERIRNLLFIAISAIVLIISLVGSLAYLSRPTVDATIACGDPGYLYAKHRLDDNTEISSTLIDEIYGFGSSYTGSYKITSLPDYESGYSVNVTYDIPSDYVSSFTVNPSTHETDLSINMGWCFGTTYYVFYTYTPITQYNVNHSYTGTIPSGAPAASSFDTTAAEGETVTKASPTLTGYTFSGWSGSWQVSSTPTKLYDQVKSMSKGTGYNVSDEVTTSNSGVYEYTGSSSEESSHKIYFYRGQLGNIVISGTGADDGATWPNYVKIGNYCWRIMRTTGSGGVKMIYNGAYGATTSGSCANSGSKAVAGNPSWNTPAMMSIVAAGYTYNDSVKSTTSATSVDTVFGSNSNYASINTTASGAKEWIEGTWWVQSGLSDSMLEGDAGYCNDRQLDPTATTVTPSQSATTNFLARTRAVNIAPTLECGRGKVDLYSYSSSAGNGNGQLTHPVALATIDEYMLMGSDKRGQSSSWLNIADTVWLFSPFQRGSSKSYLHFYFASDATIGAAGTIATCSVRPVISLISNTVITGGSGTANDPWTISTSGSTTTTTVTTAASETSFTMPAANVTLTGSWTPNTYTITLNNHNATTSGSTSATATYNSSTLTSIANPQRKYTASGFTKTAASDATVSSTNTLTYTYPFKGWYTATSGGTQIIDTSGALTASNGWTNSSAQWTSTSNQTVYAQWNSGTAITLPTITKTGYTCAWANSQANADSGTKAYDSGETNVILTADVVLYGFCTAIDYTVTATFSGDYTATDTVAHSYHYGDSWSYSPSYNTAQYTCTTNDSTSGTIAGNVAIAYTCTTRTYTVTVYVLDENGDPIDWLVDAGYTDVNGMAIDDYDGYFYGLTGARNYIYGEIYSDYSNDLNTYFQEVSDNPRECTIVNDLTVTANTTVTYYCQNSIYVNAVIISDSVAWGNMFGLVDYVPQKGITRTNILSDLEDALQPNGIVSSIRGCISDDALSYCDPAYYSDVFPDGIDFSSLQLISGTSYAEVGVHHLAVILVDGGELTSSIQNELAEAQSRGISISVFSDHPYSAFTFDISMTGNMMDIDHEEKYFGIAICAAADSVNVYNYIVATLFRDNKEDALIDEVTDEPILYEEGIGYLVGYSLISMRDSSSAVATIVGASLCDEGDSVWFGHQFSTPILHGDRIVVGIKPYSETFQLPIGAKYVVFSEDLVGLLVGGTDIDGDDYGVLASGTRQSLSEYYAAYLGGYTDKWLMTVPAVSDIQSYSFTYNIHRALDAVSTGVDSAFDSNSTSWLVIFALSGLMTVGLVFAIAKGRRVDL